MGLLDLIVKTGIANAIAMQLGGLKGNKDAVAETIENNVRRKIIKEHLNDPAYYEKISAVLDEIIKFRKEKADDYETYLQKIADLAKLVNAGHADDMPDQLKASPALRALYSNLKEVVPAAPQAASPPAPYMVTGDPVLNLALNIDATVRLTRPDGWRGIQTRENVIKRALLPLLGNDVAEVERIFLIIRQQSEY